VEPNARPGRRENECTAIEKKKLQGPTLIPSLIPDKGVENQAFSWEEKKKGKERQKARGAPRGEKEKGLERHNAREKKSKE